MALHVRSGLLPWSRPRGAVRSTGHRLSPGTIGDDLWRILTSMRFSVMLLLALTLLSLLGAVIIQAPPGTLANPEAKAEWLAELRPRFGGWTDIMERVGLFSIFSSFWFKSLVAFLAASLVACSAQRTPSLWRTATKSRIQVSPGFFDKAVQRDRIVIRADGEDALPRLVAALRGRGYRPVVEGDGTAGTVTHLYADRNRWAPFAGVAAHLSLVVIFAGVMIGTTFGYRDSSFMVPEGSTVEVASGDGLAIRLESFEGKYFTDTGAPADYASQVTLLENGREVATHTIRVNDPLRYGSLSFYQSFFGPAAVMAVRDPSGLTLFEDGVPLAWSTIEGDRRVGSFTVPGRDITVWVVGTGGSNDNLVQPGQMRVELYRASTGSPIGQQTLDQGDPVTVDGLSFTFVREHEFTGLSVSRDPGVLIVWFGCLLLVVGFTMKLFLPFRRLWARLEVRPDGRGVLSIAAPGGTDVGAGRAFSDLVIDIRAACNPSHAS